jgi:hypothetical protein
MKKELLHNLKDASFAILPIVIALLVINFCIPGLELNEGTKFGPIIVALLISVVPLIFGTTLFSIGAEKSVAKIGEIVGTKMTKKKALFALLVVAFLLGLLATIAEPDLAVLAERTGGSNGKDWSLIIIAAIGVGIFLTIGILRVALGKSLKYWLAIGYGLVFTLGCLADKNIFSIVFDAGGVTTGVVTVPFIIALGVSVANVLGGKKAEDASFGFSGLCSLGTVLFVMIYMVIMRNLSFSDSANETIGGMEKIQNALATIQFESLETYEELGKLLVNELLTSLKNVAISMVPMLVFFILFNIYAKVKGKALMSIYIGFGYTFVGLVLFFLGAESGFIPFAYSFGTWFGKQGKDILWLLVLVGIILGFISMLAEPAVKILADNVSEVSRGSVSKKVIYIALGLATSSAISMNALRVTFDIDIMYFVIPLFIIAIVLAFLAPEIFVGIAIDAAGVATGTMASCFFLPLFIGYTQYIYGSNVNGQQVVSGVDMMRNGFGVVGLMSIMPIIAVEIIGISTVAKEKYAYRKALLANREMDDSQIIHLPDMIQTEVN